MFRWDSICVEEIWAKASATSEIVLYHNACDRGQRNEGHRRKLPHSQLKNRGLI